MNRTKRPAIESFQFRDLHPLLLLGTASDRYAGWIGQIYTRERYGKNISRRTKKVGETSFVEEVLPVSSVGEYFEHFRTLELDFTFYTPLVDGNGKPTRVFHLLHTYCRHVGDRDRLVLKAPQTVFAKKRFRQGRYTDNDQYLNAEIFLRQFYEPAVEVLGHHLDAIVFEQEYQKKSGRTSAQDAAEELDAFFKAVPTDTRYHVELRTQALLTAPVFNVLKQHGVGQVLSHWTWLPSLSKQFSLSGNRFLNRDTGIIRLMTPRGVRYEDAYARAHPFRAGVSGMQTPGMIENTVEIVRKAIEEGIRIHVIVNNRAGGNAPLLARQIAHRFVTPSCGNG